MWHTYELFLLCDMGGGTFVTLVGKGDFKGLLKLHHLVIKTNVRRKAFDSFFTLPFGNLKKNRSFYWLILLADVNGVCMCVCVYMCIHTCQRCAYVCSPISLHPIFETWILTKHWMHVFGKTRWPWNFRYSPVAFSLPLGSQMCAIIPGFLRGFWGIQTQILMPGNTIFPTNHSLLLY